MLLLSGCTNRGPINAFSLCVKIKIIFWHCINGTDGQQRTYIAVLPIINKHHTSSGPSHHATGTFLWDTYTSFLFHSTITALLSRALPRDF